MSANLAIYYHPDGFDTKVPKLMGRQSAGEGFLRGWVRHAAVDRLYCQTQSEQGARHFVQAVKALGWTGPVEWIPPLRAMDLRKPGALFVPGPGLAGEAWIRRRLGPQRGYSLIGITHTTASAGAMDSLAEVFSAPVQPWDAVICTSNAVRAMVRDLLESTADFMRDRYGVPPGGPVAGPQLPVIPLGVECDLFAHDADARARWHDRLGIGPDDVVVLFMGRLSFHAKAHPLVMYRALQRVAQQMPAGRRLHLIEAGWFANDFIRDAYIAEAGRLAPSVLRHVIDGRQADTRYQIWHAADIFCSLVDNIQETFGLTPLEAMAAGLPSVVSDWDGYKDTIRDGIDGFRVPTWMPPAPLGEDLALAHAVGEITYDTYCGISSQFVTVDEAVAFNALNRLVHDGELRRRMGQEARRRAKAVYDWSVVIAQYQILGGELAVLRGNVVEKGQEVAPPRPGQPPWPQRSDPFRSFATYPTYSMGMDVRVERLPIREGEGVAALLDNPMIRFAARALPSPDYLEALLARLPSLGQSISAKQAFDELPPTEHAIALRCLSWFAKHGLIRLSPPQGHV
jgi:glycosyltransferase involved in cell wall biosynthesis